MTSLSFSEQMAWEQVVTRLLRNKNLTHRQETRNIAYSEETTDSRMWKRFMQASHAF